MMSFAPVVIMLFYFVILGFMIYFLLSVLQFMKNKHQNDQLLIKQIEALSQQVKALNEKDDQ